MRRMAMLATALALMAWFPGRAPAAYPERPVRLLVPFPAGGAVDITARLLSGELARQLGGTVLVDNRPGAGGVIATDVTAKAPPDGYTLLLTSPNHTINPALYPKLPYDTERDLTPVCLVAAIPELLVATATAPFADFPGFVSYARAHPGKLNYASAGNGTLPHVTMELLLRGLKLDVLHVAYKGAAPAMTDLLAGAVQIKLDTYATSAPHLATGKLKGLAVARQTRLPQLPQLPTIAESGLPGYEGILWMGIVAPAATPGATITQLAGACATALQSPELRARLTADGIDPMSGGPAEFAKLIARELPQWRDLVRDAHIVAD
jgi:tripartite-type tricarboxylate transporter receptor subunit TctC